ncbi:chorismate mutase [Pseudomonas sp. 7P_10.2_Bac1]|uniref:chorismate mutase n=1 Tax=Pseudomonas sp. 7P_10.2_Bac1 TaxID=2971614 RepID=UPI0021C938F2|nr:chorismate mutase [Pseudomonas sp. 7P_10.2_Bac1]MCU1727665.1 chorismate mutase [Pseudomonas sp. 7P_10.2_Bac1]
MAVNCDSLEHVRGHIDALDRQIVALLAERGAYVSQAARFKKDSDAVRAPQRVEQVIHKVRNLADELGANPEVAEAVYRAMIAGFIQQELAEHSALDNSLAQPK